MSPEGHVRTGPRRTAAGTERPTGGSTAFGIQRPVGAPPARCCCVERPVARGLRTPVFLALHGPGLIGSFAVVTLAAGPGDARTGIADLAGLAGRRPTLALAFTVFLLGQAGVPFTSGFFAKFYVIDAAVESRSYWLALVAMLAAVVAAFVYLRIMVAMWLEGDEVPDGPELAAAKATTPIPWGAALVLVATVGFTLVFGFWPDPVVEMARDAVPALVAG